MGFFTKRTKEKDAQQESAAVQDFKSNPPITGGNSYEMRQILKAQDLINKNSIPKLNLNKYKYRIEEETYSFWHILQFHADYFANILRVRTKDHKINDLIYKCFRINFLYGGCGLYKKGDEVFALYENRTYTDKAGNITKIEFQAINDLLVCQSIDDYKKVKTFITIDIEELNKNYARLRPLSKGFGAIVTWMPFVKQQVSLLKKIFMYHYVFHRKISYKAADISTSDFELDAFFNEDIPFYVELDADLGTGNKFTTESINNGAAGGVNELKEFYNFFIETYYHLLGRRYNVDDKKERNITSEIDASQNNFDILQNESTIAKLDFLDDIKRIFGIDYEDLSKKEHEEAVDDAERIADGRNMDRPTNNKQ